MRINLYRYKKIALFLLVVLSFFNIYINDTFADSKKKIAIKPLNSSVVGSQNAQEQVFRQGTSFNTSITIGDIVKGAITAFLSVLGIIFVILIILAGYNWMTASGEEEKVRKAKNTLLRAIIGLIIIVAAYVITYFVFNSLDTMNPPT